MSTSILAPSSIRSAPDILTLRKNEDRSATIHESFVALAGDALGKTLARLCQRNECIGHGLVEALRSLDDPSFARFVTAPETTFRTLITPMNTSDETARFLRQSMLAEMGWTAPIDHRDEEMFTALGDGRIGPDGKTMQYAHVKEFVPIDVDSPYSRDIDLTGIHYRIATSRPPLTEDEQRITFERLEEVRDAFLAVCPMGSYFVRLFTKVIILQKDECQPFTSGSNGDYIGRSVISNPHWGSPADVADAVLHEAIHSFLYMQECQQSWLTDDSLYESVPRVVSPWSGRQLPIRPFLQASFVWYGLLHFWAQACPLGVFDGVRPRFLFKRAVAGFLRGRLLDMIGDYRAQLTTDICDTVDEMQTRVLAITMEPV